MDSISLRACAKINLGLDVVRRRPDGYHDVRMIMQMLDLCDQVVVTRKKGPGISLYCDLPELPCDESNIAWRAAKLMTDRFGLEDGVTIRIEKHIPLAAGMAGGSTDCAAVLEGMNEVFDLGLDLEELMKIGVKLGADVPFCLMKGTALSEGIGEILSPLPGMPDIPVLIAKPPAGVSTKYVYEHLRLDESTDHPDIDGMAQALVNQDVSGIIARLGNVLESVTIPAVPEVAQIKEVMCGEGALGALMSGSGPTVFGLFEKTEQAARAMGALKDRFPDAVICLTKPDNR
jgi:4-diphosphocytidyl-2-C-methyl-D-erythritol kinase